MDGLPAGSDWYGRRTHFRKGRRLEQVWKTGNPLARTGEPCGSPLEPPKTDGMRLREVEAQTTRIQSRLWGAMRDRLKAEPTPLMALGVSCMNDVLNTQGYTQAAWWNRIPPAAWVLMLTLAVCANALVGMGAKSKARRALLFVLPLIVALSFLLIADIDSPRRGLIAVSPRNLLSLAQSLGPR